MKVSSIRSTIMLLLLCCAVVLTGALMGGCAGSDGAAGANGTSGTNGTDGTDLTATQKAETCVLCHATGGLAAIADVHTSLNPTQAVVTNFAVASSGLLDSTGTFTITFTATGPNNEDLALDTLSGSNLARLRFAFAKLSAGAGAGDATKWVNFNYGVNDRNPAKLTHTGNDYTYVVSLATGTSPSAYTLATSGTYSGTYQGFVPTYQNYDPSAKWRVGMQISAVTGITLRNLNMTHDFVPDASVPLVNSRDIVTTAACAQCHGLYSTSLPHSRYDTKYCQACHTEEVRRRDVSVVLQNAVHQIHTSQTTSSFNASLLVYPQDIRNCTTCHQGGAESSNWKNVPTKEACGSCHTTVNWVSGTNHIGGAQATNAGCVGCHSAVAIEGYHVTEYSTPNNPGVPTGAVNFKYVISAVTVTNTTQPLITFAILQGVNSTPTTTTVFDLCSTGTATVMTGFTNSPSFLVAYADGTDTSIDYNNKGRASAQPASISILNICNGTSGVMTGPDGSGNYTARITDAAAGFPVGSKIRSIALQGYFTQSAGTNGIVAASSRHTLSTVKNVTGDVVRRAVIDPAKCGGCHEVFEGHGGNRNISADSTGINICVLCHVPNLSSSGTTVNLTHPEATQNMKDMIHSIHAGDIRTTAYTHARAKSGVSTIYDWSGVVFPGKVGKCDSCHLAGTYGAIPTGALPTTDRIGSAATTTAGVTSLRATVPNASDLITSPFTSTCIACHDDVMPSDHMELQGGWIKGLRTP